MNTEPLTIRRILETFDKNTTLKARCLLSDYSETTIEGKVFDVASGNETLPGIVRVTIKPDDAPEHRPFCVTADFSALPETETYERLAELQKGETLKIYGQINYTTPNILSLGNSRIIENYEN